MVEGSRYRPFISKGARRVQKELATSIPEYYRELLNGMRRYFFFLIQVVALSKKKRSTDSWGGKKGGKK